MNLVVVMKKRANLEADRTLRCKNRHPRVKVCEKSSFVRYLDYLSNGDELRSEIFRHESHRCYEKTCQSGGGLNAPLQKSPSAGQGVSKEIICEISRLSQQRRRVVM